MAAPVDFRQYLQGVTIVEKDINGDVLVTWSFPAVNKSTQEVIKLRSGLQADVDPSELLPFRFSKFKHLWLYSLVAPIASSQMPKVTAVSICLCTTSFNPNKFSELLKVMVATYVSECSPVAVMKQYLAVCTTGKVISDHGQFADSKFDDRRALVVPTKDLFTTFGMETIAIWTAMLLKKRIFVYCTRLDELLAAVRCFPLLGAWHRLDWTILRPFMTLNPLELADLESAGVYVAGFTDPACAGLTQSYDLFVDLTTGSMTIPDHAKADFTMTKFHKDLAKQFLANPVCTSCYQGSRCTRPQPSQRAQTIATKTKELIANIHKLKTAHEDGEYVTREELRAKQLPPNMDGFLFNVALAEKLGR